jgi:hypothetical protein
MRHWKAILLGLAAFAVAGLVIVTNTESIAAHLGLGILGLAALDCLASVLYGGKFVLGSAGSTLGELLRDKPFRRHVLDRWASLGVLFHHETNEEISHQTEKTGRAPKLHSYNPFTSNNSPASAGGVEGRIEENYLYSTRRFPLNTTNNTIGSGAVAAGDYNFFTAGVGDPGSGMGYFSISNLTYMQTNMAPSGKIPQNRGFKLFDLGVSFNAQASAADIAQLLDTCSLSFRKQAGQLQIFHGPIILWPGGVGPSGYAATAVGGSPLTIAAATNGVPQLVNQRRMRNPRILSANDDFQYVVSALATTPNVNGTVGLSAFVEMRIALFGFVLDRIPN